MLQQQDVITPWDQLQEPRCSTGTSTSFLRLLAALDSGWNIYGYVELRPAGQRNEKDVFCFTLVRSDGVEMRKILVPPCHELARFISQERLALWAVTHANPL